MILSVLFYFYFVFFEVTMLFVNLFIVAFVTIVYKIKTNFKNNKHLILFELLLFLYNVIFIHIDVG
jgi:hypothetical protein